MGYLTTTGRRTGESRTVPLLHVPSDAGNPVVMGTNFGGDDHPLWVRNLEALPSATWAVGATTRVIANELTGTAYERCWTKFLEVWPGYAGYIERSGRLPKMYELLPAPDVEG